MNNIFQIILLCFVFFSKIIMKFVGKVVLITGAGSGIGAATAKHFHKLGATLALVDNNIKNLEHVASELPKCRNQKQPLLLMADVTCEKATGTLIDETIKKFCRLDVLINNAGILELGTIETTSLEQYDRVMNANVRSVYNIIMLSVPYLIQSKGNIVNVSSINGIRAFSGVLAYCVSKAAINHLTRCVALDLAAKKVRVNSVNPGVIVTSLFENSGQTLEQINAFLKRASETHPLGRTGKPEEVANSIAFLASDEHASFITGVCLSVDGGKHALCPR